MGREMKKHREQLPLGLAGDKQRPPSAPERTLEVNYSYCGAKFVAYYGFDDEKVEEIEVRSCGLCHSDEFMQATLGVRPSG